MRAHVETDRRHYLRDIGRMAVVAALTGPLMRLLPGFRIPIADARPGAEPPGPGETPVAEPVGTFSPLRPPATPLAVRSMYLSTWLTGDALAGEWARFWNGATTGMAGIVQVDGVAYLFAGDVSGLPVLPQVSLTITATASTFHFAGVGIALTVTFLSPVDPTDLQRQCVPLSYITVSASSVDGKPHRMSVYLDIAGEWAHGDRHAAVGWAQQTTGPLCTLTMTPAQPAPLSEVADQASWGTVVFATDNGPSLSRQIGDAATVRATGARAALSNAVAPGPKAIDDGWPVLAFRRDLGTVTATPAQVVFILGHVRTPAVSYLGSDLEPWWRTYWPDWPAMATWFRADYPIALRHCAALDKRITTEATAAVDNDAATGAQYGALCALALRQTFAGTELVRRNGAPWALLKEISSDGNVSTVDVLYPAMPAFLTIAPDYLRLLLEPVLSYAGPPLAQASVVAAITGPKGWSQPFAPHDLGTHYPVADGHNDGGGENMPVEESANMLIMSAALITRLPAASTSTFVHTHYPTLRSWAEYLIGTALDPGWQNQTDDFTGFIAHSSNLALKGIIGIGAMGLIAYAAGKDADATRYRQTASDYIIRWAGKSMDASGAHLKLAYDREGTWSLKYNGYADVLLGLGLIPTDITELESAWYATRTGSFGVPLDLRHTYTKADWELWTAGFLAHQSTTRNMLIQSVFRFADQTPDRVPFTDWYDTATGARSGFAARPVIGGIFSLLALRRRIVK